MSAFPNRGDISNTSPNPNMGVARTAFGALWDAITGLLGTDGTAATARIALAIPSPGRNYIMNAAMNLSDYFGTGAVTPTAFATTLNRWRMYISVASKLTFQQVLDAPAGLKNSLKISVATQYAPGSTENFFVFQAIEGINIVDWQYGTAGAVTLVTSNYIKGSVAGNYPVALRNAANTQSCVGIMAVTTAWQRVSITFPKETAGTWVTTEGVAGCQLIFDLGSGTTFNTTAGAWQSGNFLRTSGCVTFVNQTAGSTLNITGVQLEKNGLTDFELKSTRADRLECGRYARKLNGLGQAYTTTAAVLFSQGQQMAATPAIVNTAGWSVSSASNTNIAVTGWTVFTSGSADVVTLGAAVASGLAAGNSTFVSVQPANAMIECEM